MSGPAPREDSAAGPPGLIFLVGATGVGKTAVALALAGPLDAEILSIDSRAAYRKFELGTAKPSEAERAAIAHHLLDLFDPHEVSSAGVFREYFLTAWRDIRARRKRALAVGGSGLYIDACLGRFDRLPRGDATIRAAHLEIVARDPAELHRRLQAVDPESGARLSPNDIQRVSRALEVYEQTGTPLSRLQTMPAGPLDVSHGPPLILLTRSRADLYARIERRAAAMIAAGLYDEVRRLAQTGVRADSPGMEAIGYAEFARAIAGEISIATATELFIRATRRYAKRQETWFRNRYSGGQVVCIKPDDSPETTAEQVLSRLAEHWGPADTGPFA